MKRMVFAAVAALVTTGMLVASGSSEAPTDGQGPVEIVYYTYSASPNHLEELDAMVAQFNEQEDDITVRVETVGWDNYFTRLESQIAGGDPPDVFETNYENFVNYASKGMLLPLDEYAAGDSGVDVDLYYPRALQAFNLDGVQYGLPATFSTSVLFYNKDLFDAAGLDYPDASWTWDDALEAAQVLTDPDAGVWGLYSPIQFWEFYKKAAQNGGTLLADGEATIDAPENVEALEFMVSMIDEYGVMPRESDLAGVPNEQAFLDGDIAMLVSGIWMFDTFQDADFAWDITVEPGLANKATHYFADGLAISATTDHSEAAWKWISFFTASDEMVRTRMESNWGLPVLQDLSLVDAYLEQTPPDNREAVFDSLEYAIVPPVIERQNQMQDIVGLAIENVLLGNQTAAEALADADRQVDQLIR